MNANRLGLLVGLIACLVLSAQASDQGDYLDPSNGTQPVALMGGDTPLTFQVSCSSNSGTAASPTATLLIAARNFDRTNANQAKGRPRRKVCFQNRGANYVSIGSSTIPTSDFWVLGESTSTANYNSYCTNNSGAYYCAAEPLAGPSIVTIIEETQSYP